MCGIISISRLGDVSKIDDDILEKNKIFSSFMLTYLLEETESRGKDATGIAALFADGNYFGVKIPTDSTSFMSKYGETISNYNGFLKKCFKHKQGPKTIIGHCRKTSAGTNDNVDNHPIICNKIIGVHNGTLTINNVKEIFEYLQTDRSGSVDSEAIFRLMQHYTEDCTLPFSMDILKNVARSLNGSFATVCFNGNNPHQLPILRDTRPIVIGLIKSMQTVIVVSDKDFIKTAIMRYNNIASTILGMDIIKDSDIDYNEPNNLTVSLINLANETEKLSDIIETDTIGIPKVLQGYVVPTNTVGNIYASPGSNNNYSNINSTINKNNSNVIELKDKITPVDDNNTDTVDYGYEDKRYLYWSDELNVYLDSSTTCSKIKYAEINSKFFTLKDVTIEKSEVTPINGKLVNEDALEVSESTDLIVVEKPNTQKIEKPDVKKDDTDFTLRIVDTMVDYNARFNTNVKKAKINIIKCEDKSKIDNIVTSPTNTVHTKNVDKSIIKATLRADKIMLKHDIKTLLAMDKIQYKSIKDNLGKDGLIKYAFRHGLIYGIGYDESDISNKIRLLKYVTFASPYISLCTDKELKDQMVKNLKARGLNLKIFNSLFSEGDLLNYDKDHKNLLYIKNYLE